MPHSTTPRPEDATSGLVTVFSNAKNPIPVEDITLDEALDRIRSGKYQPNVDEVLAAEPDEQQDVKARVLPAFTPAGRFNYRSKEGFVEHSGLGVVDIDDKTDAEGYKARLALDPHVLAASRSPRGGVKVHVPLAVVDPTTGEMRAPASDEEHKACMAAVLDHFSDFDPDPSGTDVARLCYFSADPDVYVNVNAEPIEVDMASIPSSIDAEVRAGVKAAGRAAYDAIIPQGTQYNTLLQMTGALRRLGIGTPILTSVARAVYENHLENPNNWAKVEKMVHDIAQKPVEPHTSAEEMARRAAKTLKKHGLLAELDEDAESHTNLPWRPFPVHALPPSVQDYVVAQATALGADPAFVAVPSLAVLASAVGNSFRISLKRSWHEITTVWTVVVADSGSGKSPAMQAALAPVYELERMAKEKHEAAMAAYAALDKEQQNAAEEPHRERYRVSDTTVESLISVHAANPRGLLLARDELAGWLGSFDRYSRGEADQQAWIEMHGGRPVSVDRKSSNKPVLNLDRPNVSVAGTIQPHVLRDRLGPSHYASGFAARLLLAEPPVRVRGWTDADVTKEVHANYHRLVRCLYAFPMATASGAQTGSQDLTLSTGAKTAFVKFVEENAEKQHPLPSGPLKSALSKHEALAARFSLALHLADHVEYRGAHSINTPPDPISESAMRRGVLLARWFRYETARLYQKYGVEEHAVERDVRLAAELPETIAWQDVAETWEVKKSGAFKVIGRLIDKELVEDAGHGSYRKLASAQLSCGLIDFGDFEFAGPEPSCNEGSTASTDAHPDIYGEGRELSGDGMGSDADVEVSAVHQSSGTAEPPGAESPSPDVQQRSAVRLFRKVIRKNDRGFVELIEVEEDDSVELRSERSTDVEYGVPMTIDEIFENAPPTKSDSPAESDAEDGRSTSRDTNHPDNDDGTTTAAP